MPPSNENLTAVLYGIEDLRLENQSVPEITDDGEHFILNRKKTSIDFLST